jgi:deazaflavin-dependent oxidoreductase (nitroreductase family)
VTTAPSRRPKRVQRAIQRAPLLLYRVGLAGLMSSRLRLTTIGRRTGMRRYSILEVMEHDAARGEYLVGAVWGPESDWFKNLAVRPAEELVLGKVKFAPAHRILDVSEAAAAIDRYKSRRPRWSSASERMVGRALDAANVPVIAFRQREPSEPS